MSIVKPFRLAFRTEGSMVNCYFAAPDTMEGARLVSAMPRRILQAEPQLWEDWRALMRRALSVMCREAIGSEPVEFTEEVAPEHERGGNA